MHTKTRIRSLFRPITPFYNCDWLFQIGPVLTCVRTLYIQQTWNITEEQNLLCAENARTKLWYPLFDNTKSAENCHTKNACMSFRVRSVNTRSRTTARQNVSLTLSTRVVCKYHLKEQHRQLLRLKGESKPWSCLQSKAKNDNTVDRRAI